MWECGLKQYVDTIIGKDGMSLPMWECGLKRSLGAIRYLERRVTPHVGVWIETCCVGQLIPFFWSLPMWECGLKLS